MGSPRFSIVIPTRERDAYLAFAIRTCLAQAFDDFEIVVCDNCSGPATRAVVESFASPKIVYVRSDVPLAMSKNWELALSRASGEFVTVIGDDDGLLLHALAEADRLLRESKLNALRWEWVWYRWPDSFPREDANRIRFCLPGSPRVLDGKTVALQVLEGLAEYPELPMIYNSVVHRDVLAELKRRAGAVFPCTNPDIHTGFAVAAIVGRYLSVPRPMAIAGVAAKSNGESHFKGATRNAVIDEFAKLMTEAGIQPSARVPRVRRSMSAVVAESFETARDAFFAEDPRFKLRRGRLVARIVRDLFCSDADDSELESAIATLTEFLPADPRVQSSFHALVAKERAGRSRLRQPPLGFNGAFFTLDGAALGIRDTLGVAEFFEALFGCRSTPLRLPDRSTKDILRHVTPPALWHIAHQSKTGLKRYMATTELERVLGD